MSTILEYLVLTLGLTCIIIGVGGWLLPYLQRLRQRGWSFGHDPDDDDPEVRGLAELAARRLADADEPALPVARVALWPPAPPGAASPPPSTASPTAMPAIAPVASVAITPVASSVVRLTSPPAAIADDEEEEDLLAGVDLEGIDAEREAASAAAAEADSDAPSAPLEDEPAPVATSEEDDFMSLFVESATVSRVPDVLKQAIEPVSMDALLAEARELQRLLSQKP